MEEEEEEKGRRWRWREEEDRERKAREFDVDMRYVPFIGLTQAQRWQRAAAPGHVPPLCALYSDDDSMQRRARPYPVVFRVGSCCATPPPITDEIQKNNLKNHMAHGLFLFTVCIVHAFAHGSKPMCNVIFTCMRDTRVHKGPKTVWTWYFTRVQFSAVARWSYKIHTTDYVVKRPRLCSSTVC